jgi:hypothetical protein
MDFLLDKELECFALTYIVKLSDINLFQKT